MKLFHKEKRDLLNEVNRSEKELQIQVELKKKLQSKIDEMRRKYETLLFVDYFHPINFL